MSLNVVHICSMWAVDVLVILINLVGRGGGPGDVCYTFFVDTGSVLTLFVIFAKLAASGLGYILAAKCSILGCPLGDDVHASFPDDERQMSEMRSYRLPGVCRSGF